MTTHRLTQAAPSQSVATALATLRDHGLRVSAARRLVIEALFAAGRPVSADQIAGGLGGRLPAADLASVYRNLETFEAIGLVLRLHAGHGPSLYALPGRDHLVCDRCGYVRTLDPRTLDPLRGALRRALGWHAHFTHFPIVGTCPSCAAEADASAAP